MAEAPAGCYRIERVLMRGAVEIVLASCLPTGEVVFNPGGRIQDRLFKEARLGLAARGWGLARSIHKAHVK